MSEPTLRPAPRLAIVVPCYNEHEVFDWSCAKLLTLLSEMKAAAQISADSYLMFVNDGSKDHTWQLIEAAHAANPTAIKGICFAHNAGHQNAVFAGLMEVAQQCDCAVSIDADLQDSPEAIKTMVEKYRQGSEIVFGVRSARATDTRFKRATAHGFYALQQSLGIETIFDHADFRLMSRKAIEMLGEYGESNLFLRGLVMKLGMPTAVVTYARDDRKAGETKYTLSKMLGLAVDGITSMTARPMRLIFLLGIAMMILVIIVGLYALISYFTGAAITGWTSLILSVWFLGGMVLAALGIVGEYVGKIFIEVKHRPRYHIYKRI